VHSFRVVAQKNPYSTLPGLIGGLWRQNNSFVVLYKMTKLIESLIGLRGEGGSSSVGVDLMKVMEDPGLRVWLIKARKIGYALRRSWVWL